MTHPDFHLLLVVYHAKSYTFIFPSQPLLPSSDDNMADSAADSPRRETSSPSQSALRKESKGGINDTPSSSRSIKAIMGVETRQGLLQNRQDVAPVGVPKEATGAVSSLGVADVGPSDALHDRSIVRGTAANPLLSQKIQ